MRDDRLSTILDDCVNRLREGQTVADCLAAYPDDAAELESLLEAGLSIRRALPLGQEVASAQAEQWQRLRPELRLVATRRTYPIRQITRLAASLALVFIFLMGGASVWAQNSLPGDTLYGLKLMTESVHLLLTGDDTSLEIEFNQRRIDETRELLVLRREAEVRFEAVIDTVSENQITTAGLPPARIEPGFDVRTLQPGDRVALRAMTTYQGDLIVREIWRLGASQPPLNLPTLTPTPSPSPTMPSVMTRDVVENATARPTQEPDTAESLTCVIAPPAGWVAYRVQAGDTLSALAVSSGGTLDEIAHVNCIADTRLVRVGGTVYLPRRPISSPAATATPARSIETDTPIPQREGSGAEPPPTATPGRGRG
jgi:hypothetical protein